MKKLFLALALVASLALTACSQPADTDAATDTQAEAVSTETEQSKTYKDTMVPFDQIVPSDRIVILQNSLNYSRDGFYTEDTKPVTEEIQYGGAAVQAYPITYTVDFLTNELAGPVTVVDPDGAETAVEAADFTGMYVIIDFTSSDAPVLYNPTTQTTVPAFAYALTSEGEAIYSITSDTAHNGNDIMAKCGWDAALTYHLVATDKFYIPVVFGDYADGELRGTLSGSINASFPNMTIASGKLNDVLYIEKIAE